MDRWVFRGKEITEEDLLTIDFDSLLDLRSALLQSEDVEVSTVRFRGGNYFWVGYYVTFVGGAKKRFSELPQQIASVVGAMKLDETRVLSGCKIKMPCYYQSKELYELYQTVHHTFGRFE